MIEQKNRPDYVFETSWEVGNKAGGIFTVLSTKAHTLIEKFGENYIAIGPDVWKETSKNPYFEEDENLFAEWREDIAKTGIIVRAGRWTGASNATTILIDFTSLFTEKDRIFAQLWEKFGLDSISGQWDYIEPTLFGYAAGKVVESFSDFYGTGDKKIIAHFHEWKSGAGVLYLKEKAPHIATVFTTHASVTGHAIANSNRNLYSNLTSYNPDQISRELNVFSKYSLEKNAVREADIFTCVSKITATECEHFLGRKADIITPNGFTPDASTMNGDFNKTRQKNRKQLQSVAEAVLNQKISNNSLFIVNSGRYEFRNKGIDLFIDAIGEIARDKNNKQEIVAWITTPVDQLGFRKSVKERIGNPDFNNPKTDRFLTHSLFDINNDSILKRIHENNIHNNPEDKVKVIFVPAFLNGEDGIFNMPYYSFLSGMDFSIFPSYYEPWGFTPLESIAYKVPTITTTLTGFGQWVENVITDCNDGVCIIERNDGNFVESKKKIVENINKFSTMDKKSLDAISKNCSKIASKAVWDNFIKMYYESWSDAIEIRLKRTDRFVVKMHDYNLTQTKTAKQGEPTWKKILVNPSIPKSLSGLIELSKNLWWSWNYEAADLFIEMNSELFTKVEYNPIALIEALSSKEWEDLEKNKEFKLRLAKVMTKFHSYMADSVNHPKKKVAYFSMEYGLHDTVKIYSGGLGMLAGDYLKEASDSNYNMIGVGLLYRYGYFSQRLTANGDQIAERHPQKFSHLPLIPVRKKNGDWVMVTIALPRRQMKAKVWRIDVGRVPLYLLDTDIPENSEEDRQVTHQLYGGDLENRLKQELLLGVGGIRLIDEINEKPDIYHCNEGHAAFIGLERIRNLMTGQKCSFNLANEIVKASTLFTTHTPVPAGHDVFSEDLLRTYIPHYAERLNLSWDDFMNLGRFVKNDVNQKFSMSVLALNLSQEVNGVSAIHGRVSREMFAGMYKGYFPEEMHIGHVTNGVHFPTWTSKSWQIFYKELFGEEFLSDQSNPKYWEKIYSVEDKEIWKVRKKQKSQLTNKIKELTNRSMVTRNANPKEVFQSLEKFDENALTIGFARRFATYKRAGLLFSNIERLSKIVNNPERPVQFVFAGKAHPHDKGGQDLIREIIRISKMPEFAGRIFFLEGYDMEIAKHLVRGVDIWLNTPTRPLEASGTSGEKAIMNGIMNFSVLDGWWAEGYRKGAGWALKEERTFDNQQFQNELDAEIIYHKLEDEIAPMYYDKVDGEEFSRPWIKQIKNTIAQIAPHYTMKRQLDDYINKFYTKLFDRSEAMNRNNFEMAKDVAEWKQKMISNWEAIEIKSVSIPATTGPAISLGDSFQAQIICDLKNLAIEDVGIEVLFGNKKDDLVDKLVMKHELESYSRPDGLAEYSCKISLPTAGVYDFTFRVFPKNEKLVYRQDLYLVKWI